MGLKKDIVCVYLAFSSYSEWCFQISLTGSCYTTIAITVERFLAIRHPFFIQKHNVKARVFIIPIFIYCFVYNSPRFFEYEIKYQGCYDLGNGSFSTLEYDQSQNITCEHAAYTLIYSKMRETQLYISVNLKITLQKDFLKGSKIIQRTYNLTNKSC